MSNEHEAAGPCDLFLGRWEDYQAARGRFFADRAAEARAFVEERGSHEPAGREPAPVAPAAAQAATAA